MNSPLIIKASISGIDKDISFVCSHVFHSYPTYNNTISRSLKLLNMNGLLTSYYLFILSHSCFFCVQYFVVVVFYFMRKKIFYYSIFNNNQWNVKHCASRNTSANSSKVWRSMTERVQYRSDWHCAKRSWNMWRDVTLTTLFQTGSMFPTFLSHRSGIKILKHWVFIPINSPFEAVFIRI